MRALGMLLKGVLLVVALLLGGIALFNGAIYPSHGLNDGGDTDHNKTILKAAALYAVSMNMSLDRLVESNIRSLGEGKGDFAWGIVTLRDRQGTQYRLWVSLQRFAGQWSRASANVYPDNKSLGLIIDPWDQMFFLKNTQPNMAKTRMEVRQLMREQTRRFREYRRGGA